MNGYGGAGSGARQAAGIGPAGAPWDAPVMPTNLYGASKCWAEALARVFSTSHGLSCIVRPTGATQTSYTGQRTFTYIPLCP